MDIQTHMHTLKWKGEQEGEKARENNNYDKDWNHSPLIREPIHLLFPLVYVVSAQALTYLNSARAVKL